MTDWELWACAHKLREQHGNDAHIFAGMRCDELMEQGDMQGYGVWCQILTRISILGPVLDGSITVQ